MSLWSRIRNVARGEGLNRDIDEEFEAHIAEAVEYGRDPEEARRAFGSLLRRREESRDMRIVRWLDSLRADTVFAWRQLRGRKLTSAAAILSLALAMGACAAAYRLLDALLLRPLPIAHPDLLYEFNRRGIGPGGDYRLSDGAEYPLFERMRAAVKSEADLLAISWADRTDLTWGSDQDTEKAWVQYVSGATFPTFGLQPALGRLFSESDDLKPRAQPVAVLSYDYWARRFGKDPRVLGRTFHMGADLLQVVGVASQPFTGTEPGTVSDVFIPTMMHPGVLHDDWGWIRIYVQMKPGASRDIVREKLQAITSAFDRERAKTFAGWPEARLANFLKQTVVLRPAGSGISSMQEVYGRALVVLAVLVALVLLIACSNLTNLLMAQGAARAREMALRVSIGAGRARLVHLVMVESALVSLLAVPLAAALASWAAPFVVSRINAPDQPARLALSSDWRVLGFALLLAAAATFLFGLAPAMRASAVQPMHALRGGDDPHSRGRVMHALIAAQAAFCFLVVFMAGLFAATLDRLSNQPLGFSAERLLAVDAFAQPAQPSVYWEQISDHLRGLPGVQSAAVAAWPLLSGTGSNGFIAVQGRPPSGVLAYFLNVSPGWLETMKIPLLDGRDLRPDEVYPDVAIVNEAFARQYFGGRNPVGGTFFRAEVQPPFRIVGLVADARYRNLREPITPTAYVPIRLGGAEALGSATFLVRTSSPNPLKAAAMLRREIPHSRPAFRVSNIRTQQEIDDAQTVRERLLTMLGLFFAAVATLLGGVGLYGVLDYSVLQLRREIGIRLALGAPYAAILRRITAGTFAMVLAGAAAGIGLALASARFIDALLYHAHARDPRMLAMPALTIAVVTLAAAVPALLRALRIDPAAMLRSE